MKVFRKFELGGLTWTVADSDSITEMGHCDSERAVIRLRSNLPPDVRAQTLCHELIHAIKFTAGESQHDEKEVDALGNLLHQVLKTAR